MTENFATTIVIGEDTSGPAGVLTGPVAVLGTNAVIRTRPITTMTRKDPWRSSAEAIPIISAPFVGWACDVGNSHASDLILEAMGDPGRSETDGPEITWKVGRASDVRRFDFHAALVEGGDMLVREAALASAQLVVERGRIANWITEWVGRRTGEGVPEWTPEDYTNTEYATAATTTVTVDDEELPVFSVALQISRAIKAANFTEAGRASAWEGSLAFDVIGRAALRLDSADALDALQGGILTRAIEITILAGNRTRVITIPKCACEIRERRLVGPGTYEHLMDFAVLREEGQDLITITSSTP